MTFYFCDYLMRLQGTSFCAFLIDCKISVSSDHENSSKTTSEKPIQNIRKRKRKKSSESSFQQELEIVNHTVCMWDNYYNVLLRFLCKLQSPQRMVSNLPSVIFQVRKSKKQLLTSTPKRSKKAKTSPTLEKTSVKKSKVQPRKIQQNGKSRRDKSNVSYAFVIFSTWLGTFLTITYEVA